MISSGLKQINNRKQWFFGLLAACLLVFQTSNLVHDLDLAAHDTESDCEICDLFVAAGDNGDAVPASNTAVYFAAAIVERDSLIAPTSIDCVNARRIRAPPYLI